MGKRLIHQRRGRGTPAHRVASHRFKDKIRYRSYDALEKEGSIKKEESELIQSAIEFSDVDIAIKGAEDIERLREAIEEIPTLRSFDIVDMENCKNELLLKEIEQYGRKIL